jgi:hypothetical protein
MTGSKRQCEQIKPNGQRCQAAALAGSPWCYFHDPSKDRQRTAARRAGGRRRSQRAVVLPPDTPDLALTTLADVATLLANTINLVRRGQLDVRVGNCLGYLAATLGRVLEGSDLERQLAELQRQVGELRSEQANHAPRDPAFAG